MKADANTEAAAVASLTKFSDAYARRDKDALLAVFAPDPDVLLFGTGADEKRIGRAELKAQTDRDFAQSEAASCRWTWHSVSTAGSVAWLAADGVVSARVAGQNLSFPVRLTAVLERRGDQWPIVQAHVSVPAAGEPEGQSYTTQPA